MEIHAMNECTERMNEVAYLNTASHFKKGEETDRNSGFTEENLLPTRLGSQRKLPR